MESTEQSDVMRSATCSGYQHRRAADREYPIDRHQNFFPDLYMYLV